jgi:type I restriction enzyme S subunit
VKTPTSWKQGTLADLIASVRGGFSVQSEDRLAASDEKGVLKTGAVLTGRFDASQHKFVPVEEHGRLRTPVMAGSIIFCRKNSEDSIGASALVDKDHADFYLSDLLWEIRANAAASPRWLALVLKSNLVRSTVRLWSTGTQSTMKNISQGRLLAVPVSIPTRPEQQRIVEIMSSWDQASDRLTALLTAKTQLRNGILQKLLNPAHPSRPFGRLRGKTVTFGDVFRERQDRNHGLGPHDAVTVGKYAIRKQSEHFTRSVASSDLSGYWTISPGDFVYDPMSAYYGALGRYTGTADGIVSPAYRVLTLRADVLPEFMVYVLKSHRVRFLLETRSSQGNKEGKRRLLQRDEFAAIDFVLPSQEEQQALVATVSQFEQDIERTKALLKAVQQQKQGLMQKLLTGEWRLPC